MKDYIEREKVLNDLLDQCKITGYGGLTANDVKYVFSLQTADDVKPVVRSEWAVLSEFEDCRYVECNQCKVTQVFYYNKPLTNFCPNCGADMRGEN